MENIKKFLLDLFFPIQCLGCDKDGVWLCQDCLRKIKINFEDKFKQIGSDQNLNGTWVVTDYNNLLLTKILHSFKYNFVSDLGLSLAELLIQFLGDKISKGEILKFDLIIAVPLAKKRKLWRGFNQAEILAQKVSQKFKWPLNSKVIIRKYHTHPQVGLKAVERLNNVKGIFSVTEQELIKNKKVLLIDDVITTGATMQECAKVLKQAGANEVWGLVVAKG